MRLHVHEWGDPAAPPLVCLHGVTGHGERFKRLAEEHWSKRFHVIAPDYPGFGHSSWPDHKCFAYTFDHLAKVMQDFTEQLHLDRYTLFMQDYGGPVGFRMAWLIPKEFRR